MEATGCEQLLITLVLITFLGVTALPVEIGPTLNTIQENNKESSLNNIKQFENQKRQSADVDLELLHAPCEFDLLEKVSIEYFPKHCVPVFNNRFVNEAGYRLYRSYDMEGFVFEQFYERLKRYELDGQK